MRDSSKFGYSDGRLQASPDRERFELDVVRNDAQSSLDIDLALVWRELVFQASRIRAWFFTHERCGLVLGEGSAETHPIRATRRLEILERILCGTGQKTVALDYGLAASTVAVHAKLCLESLGFSGRPSQAHPLLMRIAKAAFERTSVSGSVSFVSTAHGELRVIGVPRPDRRLAARMPPAEVDVVHQLFEGSRYADIACSRRTSPRTVANQLAAVFRRLQASGRNELVHQLFALETSGRPRQHAVQSSKPFGTREPSVAKGSEPLLRLGGV